jgi:hypothetical protein
MSRLGIHAAKIEAIREQRGLTPAGFKTDGTDMAGATKKAMEQEMYRRADAHLPSGLGGPAAPANAGETHPDED